ncbi:mPR-like GPCR protein [Nemania abortiva]|nr:mPR-like GPCR protein [Nemania abortiva]
MAHPAPTTFIQLSEDYGGSTINSSANPSSAIARTFILSGHRPEKRDYRDVFMSLTFLHNETCLLMLSYLDCVEQFWQGTDLLGIIIAIVGIFISGIYYLIFCEPSLRKVYWAMNWAMGTVTGILISNPSLRIPGGRKLKVGAFVIFGYLSFIHLLHRAQRYGFEYILYQIFHAAILRGMWAHAASSVEGFPNFYIMNVCRAQGIGQGS